MSPIVLDSMLFVEGVELRLTELAGFGHSVPREKKSDT